MSEFTVCKIGQNGQIVFNNESIIVYSYRNQEKMGGNEKCFIYVYIDTIGMGMSFDSRPILSYVRNVVKLMM